MKPVARIASFRGVPHERAGSPEHNPPAPRNRGGQLSPPRHQNENEKNGNPNDCRSSRQLRSAVAPRITS
jgi:hypothetical protein